MPVTVDAEIRQLTGEESSRAAYDVMHCVFAVHNELGRFFDEDIYRDEIARRVADVRAEVLIAVAFREFRKPYFMDLLAHGGFVSTGSTWPATTSPSAPWRKSGQENEGQENRRMRIRLYIFLSPIFLS
jgi:hypothetical protein